MGHRARLTRETTDKVGPNEGQQFYEKEFEAPYIQRLKHFYSAESTQFLSANGVSLYLQKAEERIAEEKQNAEYLGNYLATSDPKVPASPLLPACLTHTTHLCCHYR